MRLLVLLLMFGLWPGAAEAFVDVGHTLISGHSVDSADCHDESDADRHEHHCSGLFHLCGCHASSPTTLTVQQTVSPTKWSELPALFSPAAAPLVKHADGAAARATRPPIA